jgi:GDP-4-dehydro-6-deoxy-D-mannose reductase
MKTLVIGGGGFVGHYLIGHLLTLGWDVETTCLPGEDIFLDVPAHRIDILNGESIASLFERMKPQAAIHLAAQSSVALSWKEPALTADVNIKGAINLLEAARGFSGRLRILLVGSSEQYGAVKPEQIPITEDANFEPGNIYAVTKATQDMIGKLYVDAYGMDIIRTRSFAHIGPRQTSQFVVSDFCRQIALIEKRLAPPVIKVGNLAAKRDFTDVRDVAEAYALLCVNGQRGEAYNVGSGKSIPIQSVLETALSYASTEIKVEIDQAKFRPLDVPVIEADISKIKRDTGWEPKRPVKETILQTLDYWREFLRG